MLYIVYGKFRKKPTKEMLAQIAKLLDDMTKDGIKIVVQYWTLGRYDILTTLEANDEKTYMKHIIKFGDFLSLETLVAVPRPEAIKLVE